MSRRVVVTGLGALTPLGHSLQESWTNLLKGNCGLLPTTELPNYEQDYAPVKMIPNTIKVGKVSGFDPTAHPNLFSQQDLRRMSLFTQFALFSSYEALNDASLLSPNMELVPSVNRDRVGCVIGSGIASIQDSIENIQLFSKGKRISPMFVPKILNNMAAGNLSIKFQLRGITHCVSTACATGNNSVGDAYNFIKFGMNDVILAGASESSVHPLAIAGFLRAKSLSPNGVSKPFDRDREGFVLGEGSGTLVLEELEHAQKRGATIYAEVAGYGLSSDAYHITSPLEDGNGAARAMEMALGDVDRNEVGYINAHATSTVLGDRAEARAIQQVFSSHQDRDTPLFVSSNKGSMGHLLGAAGAVESIFTIKALKENTIPHTLNLQTTGGATGDIPEYFQGLNFVKGKPIQQELKYALTNSFGFGGVNSSLLFKRFTQ